MSKPTIVVLMGGPDAEREVSVSSGTAVALALRQAGWPVLDEIIDCPTASEIAAIPGDVVFPALHGPWGEGGPLQALLEMDGRPFVGSSSRVAAQCMDKALTKQVARDLGVRTPNWCHARRGDILSVPPPAVVKPNDDGSSIDLSLCDTQDQLDRAAERVISKRGSALVESRICGREMTVSVLGNQVLPIIEIQPASGCYDYEAKYDREDTRYLVSPDLPERVTAEMRKATRTLCNHLGIRDVARVDFLVDGTGSWMLEVNTMPGFTDHSLLPMAASDSGMSMADLCNELVKMAISRGSATTTGVSHLD